MSVPIFHSVSSRRSAFSNVGFRDPLVPCQWKEEENHGFGCPICEPPRDRGPWEGSGAASPTAQRPRGPRDGSEPVLSDAGSGGALKTASCRGRPPGARCRVGTARSLECRRPPPLSHPTRPSGGAIWNAACLSEYAREGEPRMVLYRAPGSRGQGGANGLAPRPRGLIEP